MTVYADVLLVVNYIVNLLILAASAKILGFVVKRVRLMAGSLLGAVGALIIFFPYIGNWFQILYKIALALAMTAAVFGLHSLKRFLKATFVVFAVSFIFAGVMLALHFLLKPRGLLFYNGVVYFDISVLFLIISTTAAYLILSLFERLFFSRTSEKQLYDLTVSCEGKVIALKGLADTGSNLKEPFSGAPVIVCSAGLVEKVKPKEETRFRVIPCLTVTGEGMLEAFRPDQLVIAGAGKRIVTSDVYIAASRQPIAGEYQALLNPQLIDRN